MSFFGPATHQPEPKAVAGYVGLIRETVKKRPADKTLEIVTSLFHAVGAFAVHSFGHRETLAIIRDVKTRVEETDTDGKKHSWH